MPTLRQILATATRVSSIRGMEGALVADPVAFDLLNHPDSIAALERVLVGLQIKLVGILGAGASSIVIDVGDAALRLGLGPNKIVPDTPLMIQPISSGEVGCLRYQFMPKADLSNISEHDVETMRQNLLEAGYNFSDAGTDNLGRIDGKLVVIDPGAVQPVDIGMEVRACAYHTHQQ